MSFQMRNSGEDRQWNGTPRVKTVYYIVQVVFVFFLQQSNVQVVFVFLLQQSNLNSQSELNDLKPIISLVS